jgi:hypothetical protein
MPATAASIDDLTAGATERQAVEPADARSGAGFETLRIGGQRRFLKVLSHESDWIMRVTGNTDHWELKVWQAGIYDRLPTTIDHAIVAMALEAGPHPRLGILMDDCSDHLIPPGDDRVSLEVHRAFLEHMAHVHATFWGWTDDLGLCPMENRVRFFAPETIAPELERPVVPGAVVAADEGWRRLAARAPELHDLTRALHAHPHPLLGPLADTPATFVTGDWKMGNLGHRPDGRTILLEQAYPGSGPGAWDLLWYVALNQARLPETKEATIAAYREALHAHGIDTSAWWDRQLALCTVAMATAFAWEKALGDQTELSWWDDATRAATGHLA